MDDRRSGSSGATSRDGTGVSGLDEILGGGLTRGSLVVISGPPGAGKTVLATQLAFAAARAGRRAVITTALSEPPGKLAAHLADFTFFDADLLGDAVQLLSLQRTLDDGLDAVVDEIVDAARQARATLVVVDGFSGVRGVNRDPQQARQFLYRLAGLLGALRVTTLVTNEANPRDPATFPEATTADAIIGLNYDVVGGRHRRGIEVVKVRGTAQLPGEHSLTIGTGGVRVYPRLESRVTADTERRDSDPGLEELVEELPDDPLLPERAAFGLSELEVLLSGGVTRGTSTVLAGSLGTGKTLMALHFALAGVRAGESAVYVSFRESARQLAEKADVFGLGAELREALATLTRAGPLTLLRWDPVDLNPDILADRLLKAVDASGARRLVVDSVIELERAVVERDGDERVAGYMAALVKTVRLRGISALFVRETRQVLAQGLEFSADELSVLSENVLLQQQVSYQARLHRVLSVIKMRFSAHDQTLREFTIAPPEGIRVLTPFESGADVLAGIVLRQEEGDGALAGSPAVPEGSEDPEVGP